MTVQLGVAIIISTNTSIEIDLKSLRGVPISWNMESLNFRMFACPTLLISQFSYFISIGFG